jgi:hypothetical protein
MDRNSQNAFGGILTDDVLVEVFFDLNGGDAFWQGKISGGLLFCLGIIFFVPVQFFFDNVDSLFHAYFADVTLNPGNQDERFGLVFPAEGTPIILFTSPHSLFG